MKQKAVEGVNNTIILSCVNALCGDLTQCLTLRVLQDVTLNSLMVA